MDTLTLKIPEALREKLNSYAQDKGMSKSKIVREALFEYLSTEEVVKQGAFYDLAKDLAGTVDEVPDLSSNKEYLSGYGQ